jgi:hypothetical protein
VSDPLTADERAAIQGWTESERDWAVSTEDQLMQALEYIDALVASDAARAADLDRWNSWSGGGQPDDTPGEVIIAYADGSIMLDDAIATWNPLRALGWYATRAAVREARIVELEDTNHRLRAENQKLREGR